MVHATKMPQFYYVMPPLGPARTTMLLWERESYIGAVFNNTDQDIPSIATLPHYSRIYLLQNKQGTYGTFPSQWKRLAQASWCRAMLYQAPTRQLLFR